MISPATNATHVTIRWFLSEQVENVVDDPGDCGHPEKNIAVSEQHHADEVECFHPVTSLHQSSIFAQIAFPINKSKWKTVRPKLLYVVTSINNITNANNAQNPQNDFIPHLLPLNLSLAYRLTCRSRPARTFRAEILLYMLKSSFRISYH